MAGERILIVEDHSDAVRLIQKNLETLGQDFQVRTAFSGEEALLELRGKPIELLIADVRLPGMSGLELMEKCRSQQPEIKVILISGVTDPRIRQQVAQAGANAFFFKPIDTPDFLDAVERALGLVATMLPPELELYSEEPAENAALPPIEEPLEEVVAQLADLQTSLDAAAVMLVTTDGRIAARAGDLPDPALETAMMPELIQTFRSGSQISEFLGQNTPDHFLSFRGENYDLFMSPVGGQRCLILLTRPILLQELGVVASRLHTAARSVLLSLSRQSADLDQPDVPDEPLTAAEAAPGKTAEPSPSATAADADIEGLLSGLEDGRASDADAFWEALAEEDIKPEFKISDSISYDQAAELGLAPSDD
jgi:CheY-like chemotaxis protein